MKFFKFKKKNSANYSFFQLANMIPGYVFWKDLEGRFLGSNEAHLKALGLKSFDELVGKDDFEFYPVDVANKCTSFDKRAISEKKVIKLGEEVKNKAGLDEIWVTSKAPLYDDEARIAGVIGASLDITATKKAEIRQLEEKQKLFNLAAQVAHDIQSPLAALDTVVSSLQDKIPEQERIMMRTAFRRINNCE